MEVIIFLTILRLNQSFTGGMCLLVVLRQHSKCFGIWSILDFEFLGWVVVDFSVEPQCLGVEVTLLIAVPGTLEGLK